MKKLGFLLVLGLFTVAIMGISCGGGPKVQDEVPVDTTSAVVQDTTPTPPPPPPPPPQTLKESQFTTVYFDFDKYNLRTDAKSALDQNFDILQEFPDAIVKIEGHCDERGTVEYNLSLGEKRAKSTLDYLVRLGIAPGRLSVISYGKERPADAGHSEVSWTKNRRCEFRVISQ